MDKMESLRDGRLRRDSQIKGLYEFEKTLGKGHFAIVKLAKHLYTGERVAIKVIDKSKLDEVSRVHLYQEVACMKMVKHENIVQLYEVIDSTKFLYIVQELGDGGDMYDFLTKHEGGLPEDKARDFFQQIVSAITYCHDLHIVHRDLKPENVVLSRNQDVVKITDFGFSNQYTPGTHLRTSCGSLAYSAPEILLGDSYEAAAVDVWSLGVLLFMLVCGEAPFNEGTDSETLTMIMDCKFTLPHELSDECKDLVSNLLKREPEDRLSLAQILDHPWMKMAPSPDTPLTHQPPNPHSNITHINTNTGTHYGSICHPSVGSSYKLSPNGGPVPASSHQGQGAFRGVHRVGGSHWQNTVITRDMITEEEHREIVDCMTTQNIADEPAILHSLNSEAYDHISATYFLLAEKRLKLQHDERLKALGGSAVFGLTPTTSNGGGIQPSSGNNIGGLQCQGRRSPLLFTPLQLNTNSLGGANYHLQQSTPHSATHAMTTPNSPMHALNVSSSGGVGQGGGGGGGLSNRSANASGDSSSVLSVANGQMIGGANRASMSVASSGNVMQLPLSNRSASNSFTDEQITDISDRRASEMTDKPKTQRSWSAGPGISTAIIHQGSNFMVVGRDSASPSPPPLVSRFGGVSSYESLATHTSHGGSSVSTATSVTRVPNREHLTIAPSYNRNILKEDVNKLVEQEQEQRLNLSVCENDIPNLLLVPSATTDSASKPKISSNSSSRGALQSSRLSEPHAGGLGKLVEEEGESELDDFEDGGTGPFLGGARTSRGHNSSRFKARNNSLGTLFSRKQNQQRRLSAGHSPECLRRNANSGGTLGAGVGSRSGENEGNGGGLKTTFTLSRRSTPTRSHYNSDESGGEDADNRLRNISRFSESDRSLGYSLAHHHHQQRHSFNQCSDDSSVERPSRFRAQNNHAYHHQSSLLAGMERNDLSGSSNSTPNNRRQRRKKKSLNESLKRSNLSVSSIVSTLSSKYPIDPTNNTPSDSDSVSSRKTSSYACNKLAEGNEYDSSTRLLSGKHTVTLAANLINLVEEEPMSSGSPIAYQPSKAASSSPYKAGLESGSSGSAGTRESLEGRPNVKCEYNKLNVKGAEVSKSKSKVESSLENRKRRRKTRKSRRAFFTSCMKGSVDTTISATSDEKIEGKCSESQSLLAAECSENSPQPKISNSESNLTGSKPKTENTTRKPISDQPCSVDAVRSVNDKTAKSCQQQKKMEKQSMAAGDGSYQYNDSSAVPTSRCCGIQ
ncbi:serine/threonine-protein kinase par-1-like isoform X3 [Symsagittifera roscoffensis]|uniref:serine/threonine-protein kinase par-1-like isoform X3 n=1 Tax=Symsagittifera roscoffensis TaxID=84072 RepID=UPI00307BEA52